MVLSLLFGPLMWLRKEECFVNGAVGSGQRGREEWKRDVVQQVVGWLVLVCCLAAVKIAK